MGCMLTPSIWQEMNLGPWYLKTNIPNGPGGAAFRLGTQISPGTQQRPARQPRVQGCCLGTPIDVVNPTTDLPKEPLPAANAWDQLRRSNHRVIIAGCSGDISTWVLGPGSAGERCPVCPYEHANGGDLPRFLAIQHCARPQEFGCVLSSPAIFSLYQLLQSSAQPAWALSVVTVSTRLHSDTLSQVARPRNNSPHQAIFVIDIWYVGQHHVQSGIRRQGDVLNMFNVNRGWLSCGTGTSRRVDLTIAQRCPDVISHWDRAVFGKSPQRLRFDQWVVTSTTGKPLRCYRTQCQETTVGHLHLLADNCIPCLGGLAIISLHDTNTALCTTAIIKSFDVGATFAVGKGCGRRATQRPRRHQAESHQHYRS